MVINQYINNRAYIRIAAINLLIIVALLSVHIPVHSNNVNTVRQATDQFVNPQNVLAVTQLQPPTNLAAEEKDSDKYIELTWTASVGAVKYNIYRSQILGTYPANPFATLPVTSPYMDLKYIDRSLINVKPDYYFYYVTAVDNQGGESGPSNEIAALPHFRIEWIGMVFGSMPTVPSCFDSITKFITTPEKDCSYILGDPTSKIQIAGEIFITGQTGKLVGGHPDVIGQLGFGPAEPDSNADVEVDLTKWTDWIDSHWFSTGKWVDVNDRYITDYVPERIGNYYFTYRFSTDGGRNWTYTDLQGNEINISDGKRVPGASLGYMTILPNPDDTTAPSKPVLSVLNKTTTSITLGWAGSPLDPDIYGFDVYRSTSETSPRVRVNKEHLTASNTTYEDKDLIANTTYYYWVVAFDKSFNRAESDYVFGTTSYSLVTFTMHIKVPPFTPGKVYINRQYDPSAGVLGVEEWKGLDISSCVYPTYQCDLDLSLQENTPFTFRFSRGSLETIQTQLDGNTPAFDPSFIVKAGMAEINRVVYNWDDPIVIDYNPKGSKVIPNKTVTITWNQSMPSNTTFTVFDKGSTGIGAGTPVTGSFLYNAKTKSVTFTANSTFKAGWIYRVEVKSQKDTKSPAVLQKVPTSWSFKTDKFHIFLPSISKK